VVFLLESTSCDILFQHTGTGTGIDLGCNCSNATEPRAVLVRIGRARARAWVLSRNCHFFIVIVCCLLLKEMRLMLLTFSFLVAAVVATDRRIPIGGKSTVLKTVEVDGTLLADEEEQVEDVFRNQAGKFHMRGIDHGKELIRWVREECGGYVHDGLQMLKYDKNDSGSPFGLYTTASLAPHEVILRIPKNCTINAKGTDDMCDTAMHLQNELLAGNESRFAPYVNYLIDTQPFGQLPVTWSQAGKDLLKSMTFQDDIHLPPYGDGWSFLSVCDPQPHEEYAYQLLRQRSWDDVLIPLYDAMSHGNGHWLNTECDEVQRAEWIEIRASRFIGKDEELFCSYTQYPGMCWSTVYW
jgi:hypothetical protein